MAVIRRNISLSPELNKKLVEQAAKEDRAIVTVVRRALGLYFEKTKSDLVPRKEAGAKIVVANRVPYVDESAISLVEYALEEFAKKQGATNKDITKETPYLVEVKITASCPTACCASPRNEQSAGNKGGKG